MEEEKKPKKKRVSDTSDKSESIQDDGVKNQTVGDGGTKSTDQTVDQAVENTAKEAEETLINGTEPSIPAQRLGEAMQDVADSGIAVTSEASATLASEPTVGTVLSAAVAVEEGEDKKQNPLRTEKIIKLILKFSIPSIIGMLINAIYNIVDRIFVGNSYLAGDGLAALQYCFPPMMIALGIAMMFGVGGSVLFAIALGKKDHERAHKITNVTFVAVVSVFLVLSILMLIFIRPIMGLFVSKNSSVTVFEYSVQYMSVIIIGFIFQAINVHGNNFVRVEGNPITSMVSMGIGGILNIILDYVFIFPLQMGIAGAALATIIGQGCSTAWMLFYFLSHKGTKVFRVARFRLKFRLMKPDFRLIGKICAAGLSAFVIQAAGSIVVLILNSSIGKYALLEGLNVDMQIGAMGSVSSIQTIFIMPLLGLNQGLNPILGYNYGAQQGARVKEALFKGIIIGTVIGVVGFAVAMIFPVQIISMFGDDPTLLGASEVIMRRWFLALWVLGLQIIGSNYFQSTGKAGLAVILSMARQVLLLVPLIFILPVFMGLQGIFYAAPISDGAASILTLVFLIWEFTHNPMYKNPSKGSKGLKKNKKQEVRVGQKEDTAPSAVTYAI